MSTFEQIGSTQVGRWVSLKAYWMKSKCQKCSQGLIAHDKYILAPLQNITILSKKTHKLMICELLVVQFPFDPERSFTLTIKNKVKLQHIDPNNNKVMVKLEMVEQLVESENDNSNQNGQTKQCIIHLIDLFQQNNPQAKEAPQASKEINYYNKKLKINKVKNKSQNQEADITHGSGSDAQKVKLQHVQKKQQQQIINDEKANAIVPLPEQISQLQKEIKKQKLLQKPTQRLKLLTQSLAIKNHQHGNYDQTQRISKELVPICLRLYGKQSKQHSQALEILGASNLKLFNYDIALQNYEKALKVAKQFAQNEEQIGRILKQMGIIYHEKKDLKKAEEFYHSSIITITKIHGNRHPQLAYIANNLGNIWKANQQFDQALNKYQEALQILEFNYGRLSVQFAIMLHNLVTCRFDTKKYREAIQGYHQIFTIMMTLQLWNHIQNTKLFMPSCIRYVVRLMDDETVEQQIYKKTLRMLDSVFQKQYENMDINYLKFHLDQRIIRMQ